MTASATVANLRATAARGVPLSNDFTAAAAAVERRYTLPPTPRTDLATLVADAVGKGVDPYEDAAVRTALVRGQHGATIAAALNHAREAQLAELLTEHTPAMLHGWRGPWAEAGAIVASAAAEMPGTDFARPGSVTDAGPAPARLALWSEAHAAAMLLVALASAVAALVPPNRPELVCLMGAPLTAAQHDALVASDRAALAWGASYIGVPLALVASEDDRNRRAADLRADRERANEAARRPRRQNYLTGAAI